MRLGRRNHPQNRAVDPRNGRVALKKSQVARPPSRPADRRHSSSATGHSRHSRCSCGLPEAGLSADEVNRRAGSDDQRAARGDSGDPHIRDPQLRNSASPQSASPQSASPQVRRFASPQVRRSAGRKPAGPRSATSASPQVRWWGGPRAGRPPAAGPVPHAGSAGRDPRLPWRVAWRVA
jgi:hypothetical protein